MKCLIIAAGRGSRLSPEGNSKPLFPVLGVSIIERVICTAKNCGIEDFYVVTGYRGEKVRPFLDGVKRRENIEITHVINEEWEKGNGVSVIKAKDVLNEPFVLLMADHLFDEEIIIKLKNHKIEKDEVILAVDYKIKSNRLVDINDVTKVSVSNSKVVNIGKDIADYNAYDTGIFLCTPAIFHAIERSITQNNDESLSGGIKMLAKEGKVKTFDVEDNFWLDIDDQKTFLKAEQHLINKLKKPSDGPVSKYFNRPLSIKITKYIVKTRITPNQISFFSFVLSLIAATFFFFTSYLPLLIGGILAQISSIIDGCDGEVARLKYRESNFGGWFDAVLDRYADAFLLFGLTYNTFARSGNVAFLIVGFFAIIGSFMNSYTADKYDKLMKRQLGYTNGFRIGRDIRIFLIFIGAIIYQPFLILLILAFLMNAENIRRVMICYKYR